MNMTEHNDAQFTKQKDDLECYLMRIIQRYFDIERNHTRESVETMIVESLTRLKRTLLKECKFIFNLNGEAGNVTLNIQKLGGEPAFEKRTAFNKDFGNVADTICEGDDQRLSNDRDPLEHVHEIADVEGLRELLDSLGIEPEDHVHKNQTVLNMLKYTGTRTQIDLIELEYLEVAVNRYYENLEYLEREVKSIHDTKIESFAGTKDRILEYLKRAELIVQSSITWIDKAKQYINNKTSEDRKYYESLLKKFVTKDQLQTLKDFFSNTVQFITDGEIPLHDGTPVPNQKEDTGTTAGNGDGDSLKAIFDEGVRMGNDDWRWDEATQSFIYQHNEEQSYPLFLSLSKFQDYTHRVTLASDDSDDDAISVIIAYDDETKNHLSLVVGAGLNAGTPRAAVVFNYMGDGYTYGYTLYPVSAALDHIFTGQPTRWNALTNDVPVLVKRKDNNIKIWVNYNQQHNWQVTTQDKHQDIFPAEEPLFDFDLSEYAQLSCFMNKECRYGYGNYSQPKSTYLDVFFTSYTEYLEPFGQTIIDQQTHESFDVPASNMKDVNAGRVKMWFRHDKPDGTTEQFPLPYMFMTDNNSWGIVQGEYTESGHIDIHVNLTLPIVGLITDKNFFNNKTIIVPIGAFETLGGKINNPNLCFIDSASKNNFVKTLLKDDMEYWIEGYNFDNQWLNNKEVTMTFFDWDSKEPQLKSMTTYIYINKNKKWATGDCYNEKHGYIAEYTIRYLSEYFKNPRIYYQVYGERGVK